MSSGLNKGWMKHRSIKNNRYRLGVANFLEFIRTQSGTKCYPCPCRKCRNATGQFNCTDISDHLLMYGMDKSYTLWYLHGETEFSNQASDTSKCKTQVDPVPEDDQIADPVVNDACGEGDVKNVVGTSDISKCKTRVDPILEDNQIADPVVNDVCGEGAVKNIVGTSCLDEEHTKSKYEHLRRLAKEPLYAATAHHGESKHSMTDMLKKLNDWKTEFNYSDDCVEDLLEVVKDMLPDGNTLTVIFDEMGFTFKEVNQHCVTSGVSGNVGTASPKPKKKNKNTSK